MAATRIEYSDAVWNPVTGCSPVSEGCQHCYAGRMAYRLRGRFGYPVDEPFRVTLHPERLEEPLRWRKPRRIFAVSMGDLFHESVDEKYIAKVFAVMDLAKQHTFLILTKHPRRALELLTNENFQFHVGWFESQAIREFGLPEPKEIGPWPLRNVWVGVTAENQARADERIPILLQIPAVVRWVSCEPLLGPIILGRLVWFREGFDPPWFQEQFYGRRRIDWVVCGAETGPGARPCDPEWVRSLRDQCQAAGFPFFFKRWSNGSSGCALTGNCSPPVFWRRWRRRWSPPAAGGSGCSPTRSANPSPS